MKGFFFNQWLNQVAIHQGLSYEMSELNRLGKLKYFLSGLAADFLDLFWKME